MKRVLLKLSGEALARGGKEIYNADFVDEVAAAIKKCVAGGKEIAVVVGAGNIWRGRQGGGMDRTDADRMGMLATVINSICLKDALIRAGQPAAVLTSIAMEPFAEPYSAELAKQYLAEGKVVICGGGLGIPFFSTDTAAAVRAAEIGCDAMLMAKNVDYIYDADPVTHPDAKKFDTVTDSEILTKNLRAIDATAAAFCRDSKMPIRVFGLREAGDICRAVSETVSGTTVLPE